MDSKEPVAWAVITLAISGSRPLTKLHHKAESRVRCIAWLCHELDDA
jgi:hypothetical protein